MLAALLAWFLGEVPMGLGWNAYPHVNRISELLKLPPDDASKSIKDFDVQKSAQEVHELKFWYYGVLILAIFALFASLGSFGWGCFTILKSLPPK
jgi:hypothetical protein